MRGVAGRRGMLVQQLGYFSKVEILTMQLGEPGSLPLKFPIQAGETAYEVKVQIRQRSQALGKKGSFIMGREIFAMILDHFRTTLSIGY
eukprot:s3902_g5.t1